MSRLVFILLLVCSVPAAARMYQWTDPKTGITQLAGMPPPWYRSGQGGPRVFVFENGRLIDDTSIKVPDAERLQLRQQALTEVAGSNNNTAKRLQGTARIGAETEALAKAGEQPPQKPAQQKSPAPKPPVQAKIPPPQAAANQPGARTEEQMRQLIQRWEAAQEQNARRQADIPSPPPAAGP